MFTRLQRPAAAGLLTLALASLGSALHVPRGHGGEDVARHSPLVFCHFMMGIVGDRSGSADYDVDMVRAKKAGIDAFALNIGLDPYTDTQLAYAYKSAADNGMKVFISFDFNVSLGSLWSVRPSVAN